MYFGLTLSYQIQHRNLDDDGGGNGDNNIVDASDMMDMITFDDVDAIMVRMVINMLSLYYCHIYFPEKINICNT